MSQVQYSCTSLNGTGKKGVLTADADGYFTMVVGGLNCFNSAGEYYPLQAAQNLFHESSAFMRRIQSACLKGEYGHPQKQPGMTMDDYVRRVMTIDEKSVCVQFRKIWLDANSVKDASGRPVVAIMAELKPVGPYGDALAKSLVNPHEDVCFSIRAFTDDRRVMGVNNRNLVEIITWDYVTEPGIAFARKYKSPSLESLTPPLETLDRFEVSLDDMRRAVTPVEGTALESSIIQTGHNVISAYERLQKQTPPGYCAW